VLGATFVPKAKAAMWNFHLYGKASLGWSFLQGQENGVGPTIQVYQDTVNLTLTSDDGLPHQFFVDHNDNDVVDAGEPASSAFTTTTTFSFITGTLGNFTYRCAFHPLVMFGDLEVLTPIPEFSALVIVPLFVVLTFLAVVLVRRRRQSFL
jgi:hypothetical protein